MPFSRSKDLGMTRWDIMQNDLIDFFRYMDHDGDRQGRKQVE